MSWKYDVYIVQSENNNKNTPTPQNRTCNSSSKLIYCILSVNKLVHEILYLSEVHVELLVNDTAVSSCRKNKTEKKADIKICKEKIHCK